MKHFVLDNLRTSVLPCPDRAVEKCRNEGDERVDLYSVLLSNGIIGSPTEW